MRLTLKNNLPFINVTVAYQGHIIEIPVLVDTGSASMILAVDALIPIRLFPSPDDTLYTIRGIGGGEVVFSRQLDYLQAGARKLLDFEIEVGGMDYGFEIKGILGMDFLIQAGAVIDLRNRRIEFKT